MNHDVFRVLRQSFKNIIIVNAVGESNAFPNSKRRNCGKNSIIIIVGFRIQLSSCRSGSIYGYYTGYIF